MSGTMVVQTAPPQSTVAEGRLSAPMAVSLVQDWSEMVRLPKDRERDGAGVGVDLGGVNGPAAAELVHPPQPRSLPARTPMMYVLALSALKVRLLDGTFLWSSTGARQLAPPSAL